VARLTGWLAALPDAVLRARPALSLHASRALYLAGDLTGAERLVQQANVALRTAADTDDTAADHGLYALATVYRAAISALRGENLTEAVAAVADLPDALAVSHTHTAARAADTLALAHELLGHLAAAERAYLQASDLAQAAGVRYLAINARCEAALVQIQRGRLTEADHTCRAALELAGDDAIPPTGLAWTVLGEIARERNELETAARHLATGIELAQQGGITDDLRHAFLFLARLKQAQGDPPAALEAWRQADRILHRYNVPRLASLSAAARARLDLAQGNLAAARRWAAAYRGQSCEPSFEAVQDVEALTLIRVLLATGEPDAALDRVQPLLAAARQSGRLRTVMEGLLLRAQILWTQQSTGAATASLREAVSLAAPEEFARLFLDGGPVVAELLPDVREAAPDFVDGLLAALGLQADEVANVDEAVAPPADSIEPLSEREEEVLRLLVAGRSNREIAEALVITVGTAKWHVHNIYQKLGVGSRAEAIARVHAWSERSP
jgi:LuxR family maltose regulon positive regulatory protein